MGMRRLSAAVAISAVMLVSCERAAFPDRSMPDRDDSSRIILGAHLENPYSLRIMQAALDSLMRTRSSETEIPLLEATDYYVRLRPTDTTEYRTLMEMDLDLFEYPLDYDIEREGDFFHDPTIPDDEVTWQYTVLPSEVIEACVDATVLQQVPSDTAYIYFELTDDDPSDDVPDEWGSHDDGYDEGDDESVPGEIIDACYIPDNESTRSGISLPVSAEELEDMAFRLAGYPEELSGKSSGVVGIKPRGHVLVDGPSGIAPVRNVTVRARYLLKWVDVKSSSDGSYSFTTSFKRSPQMSVHFKDSDRFVLWGNANHLSAASYCAKKYDSLVDGDIELDSSAEKPQKWAVVSNSAEDYYDQCCTLGIATPASDLKISCLNNSTWSSAPMLHHINGYKRAFASAFGLLAVPFILIGLPDVFICINYEDLSDIPPTVFHELSHASHFSVVGEPFWGQYIEHIVVRNTSTSCYGDGLANDAKQRICELGEMWGYCNQRLKGRSSYGNIYWFNPAIMALKETISGGYVSLAEAFSCLTSSTCSVDDFFDNLLENFPDSIAGITECFVKNRALTHQTEWIMRNCTGNDIRLSVESPDTSFTLMTGTEFKPAKMGGRHAVPMFSEYDDLLMPKSISITVPSDGGREIFRSRRDTIEIDFSRSFSNSANWASVDTLIRSAGNKNITTNIYEIR